MKRGVPATIEDLEQHDCLVNPNVSDAWLYKSTEGESVPLKIKYRAGQQQPGVITCCAASSGHCLSTYLYAGRLYNLR